MHSAVPSGTRLAGATLVAIAFIVGACGSSSTPAPAVSTSPGASSVPSAVPTAPASAGSSTVSGSSPSASPAPVVSAADTPAASVSASGAKAQPSGTPCEWLDKPTIDATLGLDVGAAIPNTGDAKGKICTWQSKTPGGGTTLAILTKTDVDGIVASYAKLPGGRLVDGVGVKAAALFLTGQKSPLPKSHGQIFVDFGDWGLSVDVSGPAVTIDEAAALAVLAVTP